MDISAILRVIRSAQQINRDVDRTLWLHRLHRAKGGY